MIPAYNKLYPENIVQPVDRITLTLPNQKGAGFFFLARNVSQVIGKTGLVGFALAATNLATNFASIWILDPAAVAPNLQTCLVLFKFFIDREDIARKAAVQIHIL